jgi:hypothetical protein
MLSVVLTIETDEPKAFVGTRLLGKEGIARKSLSWPNYAVIAQNFYNV